MTTRLSKIKFEEATLEQKAHLEAGEAYLNKHKIQELFDVNNPPC